MKATLLMAVEIQFGETNPTYCQLHKGAQVDGQVKADGFFYFDCPPYGPARLNTKFFDMKKKMKEPREPKHKRGMEEKETHKATQKAKRATKKMR